jgi:hypothetical protein
MKKYRIRLEESVELVTKQRAKRRRVTQEDTEEAWRALYPNHHVAVIASSPYYRRIKEVYGDRAVVLIDGLPALVVHNDHELYDVAVACSQSHTLPRQTTESLCGINLKNYVDAVGAWRKDSEEKIRSLSIEYLAISEIVYSDPRTYRICVRVAKLLLQAATEARKVSNEEPALHLVKRRNIR